MWLKSKPLFTIGRALALSDHRTLDDLVLPGEESHSTPFSCPWALAVVDCVLVFFVCGILDVVGRVFVLSGFRTLGVEGRVFVPSASLS